MPQETVASPNTNTAAPVVDNAAPAVETTQEAPSILDTAQDTERLAVEKRILEADPKTLKPEEVEQRKVLEEAKKVADSKVVKTVPEKYEVKVPDGYSKDMSLLNTLTPVLKEIGVTNEQAQKLADAYMPFFKAKAEEGQKLVKAQQEEAFKSFNENEKKETFAKLGAKAQETLAFVAKFRDQYLSKETQEFLNASGLANNYNFISDMAKFGKMISEDSLVSGRTRGMGQAKSDGEVLYGSPEKEK